MVGRASCLAVAVLLMSCQDRPASLDAGAVLYAGAALDVRSGDTFPDWLPPTVSGPGRAGAGVTYRAPWYVPPDGPPPANLPPDPPRPDASPPPEPMEAMRMAPNPCLPADPPLKNPPPPGAEDPDKAAISPLGPDVYRLGGIIADRKANRVCIPARVAITEGILEYLAVGLQGKAYEAVFEILSSATHIQLALIMAGMRPAEYGPPLEKPFPMPGRVVYPGELVTIEVAYRDQEGLEVVEPVESFIADRSKGGVPMSPGEWFFQGAQFAGGLLTAEASRSYFAIWPDPSCILGLARKTSNPYRGLEQGLEINKQTIPPQGTLLTLVIKGTAKASQADREILGLPPLPEAPPQ